MAKMHPTYPTASSPLSEMNLFDLLRDKLNDSFHVFHSVDYTLSLVNKKVIEGQIDFLVLHPKLGLLVIEVKGGLEVFYNGDHKKWYSIDHSGKQNPIRDPYLQGRKQVHELMAYLKGITLSGFSASSLPYGHAVAFPSANPHSGFMPIHAEDWLTITAKDLGQLGVRIVSIMKRWAKQRDCESIPPKVMEELIKRVFISSFHLIYSIGDQIRDQDQVLCKMTEQQYKYIDFLESHSRVLIKGYAGTGKTVLAQEKARRSALTGKKVLFLCYNNPLMKHLSASLNGFEGNITVETFHSFCRRFIVESGQEFNPLQGNTKQFWEENVPLMMLTALERLPERFETIIVDEAQDFSANWWEIVESLLYSSRKNDLYIFYDPHQNVYHKENQFPVHTSPFTLMENCRNTRHITKTVARFAGIEMKNPENHPVGTPVFFYTYRNQEEELSVLEGIFKNLTSEEDVLPRNIVILSPYNRSKTCLRHTDKIHNLLIVESPFQTRRKQLRFCTINRFKGLESDVIIVIDIDEETENDDLRLYVASSRAKHLLFLLSKHLT